MGNYYVKFRSADDTYWSAEFKNHSMDELIIKFNSSRFILLPDSKRLINLDHIARIDIEEVSR